MGVNRNGNLITYVGKMKSKMHLGELNTSDTINRNRKADKSVWERK